MAKETLKQKINRANESPFCAEQSGKICFCVGYFVYEIRGIKRMRVQKPLQWLFVNNICMCKNY